MSETTESDALNASLRRLGFAAAAAALRDAADDLEGRLGTEGAPRNLYEFRQWLRVRADHLDTRALPPTEDAR